MGDPTTGVGMTVWVLCVVWVGKWEYGSVLTNWESEWGMQEREDYKEQRKTVGLYEKWEKEKRTEDKKSKKKESEKTWREKKKVQREKKKNC